jgi:hypothetical protein
MEVLIRLIEHLLGTNYSIDRVDSIVNQLNISQDDLLQLLKDNHYKDYFQLLRPSNNLNQGTEKIALTLDVSISNKHDKNQLFFFSNLALLLYTLCSTL